VCSSIDCCGGSGIYLSSVLFFFCFWFFVFGFLTQNPNLSQGLRVEYLHNLSTRIVVVGWEVELLFMRSVAGGVLDVLLEKNFTKGLASFFSSQGLGKDFLSLSSTLPLAFF